MDYFKIYIENRENICNIVVYLQKTKFLNGIKPILNLEININLSINTTISHCHEIQVIILYDLFGICHFKNWIMFGDTAKNISNTISQVAVDNSVSKLIITFSCFMGGVLLLLKPVVPTSKSKCISHV